MSPHHIVKWIKKKNYWDGNLFDKAPTFFGWKCCASAGSSGVVQQQFAWLTAIAVFHAEEAAVFLLNYNCVSLVLCCIYARVNPRIHTQQQHYAAWTMSRNTSYCGENVTMVVDYRNSINCLTWSSSDRPPLRQSYSAVFELRLHLGELIRIQGNVAISKTTVENWMKLWGEFWNASTTFGCASPFVRLWRYGRYKCLQAVTTVSYITSCTSTFVGLNSIQVTSKKLDIWAGPSTAAAT